jgi:hypothetical protein
MEFDVPGNDRTLKNIFNTKPNGVRKVFLYQCHHMSLMDFVVSPPVFGRRVTEF